MSEDQEQEQSQKTEEPTQRRIEEALRKGKVAFSREVNTFILLLLLTIFVSWLMPSTLKYGHTSLTQYISDINVIAASDAKDILTIMRRCISQILLIGAVPLAIALIGSILGNVLQNGFIFAPEALRFDLSRISIIAGLQRIFSINSVVEFIKSCFKVACVSIATYISIAQDLPMLYNIKSMSMSAVLQLGLHCLVKLLIAVVIVMAAIALLDYLYQKHTYLKSLMMTPVELKEEMRQTEGNPEVRAKLSAIRAERSKKRMMAAVPQADVIITNPTHYAIALQYDPNTMPAPKVVAKGMDNIALRIREVAAQHNIPIIENPPLARLLYETVKLDQFIKPEHYETVARLIYHILQLKNKV